MTRAKEQMLREGQYPHDVGLLDDTFIMPSGKNRPRWFTNYKDRMRLERKRLRIRFQELTGALGYRWWTVKPRPRLGLLKITGIAQDMHKEMYAHFASGDLQSIESKLCEGLLGSLRRRIDLRPKNTHLIWRLHKYLSPPNLVSYKAVNAQNPTGGYDRSNMNGLVQAVVRIHSLQSLLHVKRVQTRGKDGKMSTKEIAMGDDGVEFSIARFTEQNDLSNAKETVEYFVIQKSLRKSKESGWMVWGTAEETTLDKLDRQEEKARKEREKMKEKERVAGAV